MITIEELVKIAYENNASDVHITVGIPPKMRIAGMLTDMKFPVLNASDTENVITSFLTVEQKEYFNKKGNIVLSLDLKSIGRCKVDVFSQKGYIAANLKLINREIKNPVELEMPLEVINLYQKKSGLVVISGADEMEKTNVIDSIINMINENRNCHILTAENSIGYVHNHKLSMVNQREIGLDAESYKDVLESALREDTDIVYIDDMSEHETVTGAIRIAESQKLVIASMHTQGIIKTFERIVNGFPSDKHEQIRKMLAETLVFMVSVKNGSQAYEILDVNDEVRKYLVNFDKKILSHIKYK